MEDKKDNITFDDCEHSSKYDKMGVTPRELYIRQQGICFLYMAYDEIDGELVPGCLFCTDGNEYAPFETMLNPTYECMQCVNRFIMEELNNNMMAHRLDKFIFSILMGIASAKNKSSDEQTFHMTKNTFERVEEYIEKSTLYSPETKPLRITAKGDIVLFGIKVSLSNDVDENVMKLMPSDVDVILPA